MKKTNLMNVVGALSLGALVLTGCKGGGEQKPAEQGATDAGQQTSCNADKKAEDKPADGAATGQ